VSEPRLPIPPASSTPEDIYRYVLRERVALFDEFRALRLRINQLTTLIGSGSGAPDDASYVTLGTNATLTSERVLTAGTGITLTDAGAGSTITVAANGANSQFDFLFGDAADGSATLDGSTAVSWADGPAGNVYALNRNVALNNLTVNSGVALATNGYVILVDGTFTNNGTVGNSGQAASGVTAGFGAGKIRGGSSGGSLGSPESPGVGDCFLGIGQDGGTGAATTPTPDPRPAVEYLCGGAGGNGGNGSGGTGGVAATGTLPPKTEGGLQMVGSFHTLATGQMIYSGSGFTLKPRGGTGGGGGGGSNSGGSGNASQGGGGGGGGGAVLVHARTIAGSGNLRSLGGAGANAVVTEGAGGTGAGGGGGGGGGIIFVITETPTWDSLWTVSVAGGAAGTGLGTGTNGTAGSAGRIFAFISQV
jgi:hypothetical protein